MCIPMYKVGAVFEGKPRANKPCEAIALEQKLTFLHCCMIFGLLLNI
jgi:hypothetical protein